MRRTFPQQIAAALAVSLAAAVWFANSSRRSRSSSRSPRAA
jgi:hypothetical protein